MADTTLKIKDLKKLLKALKVKTPVIRVGVLGDGSIRGGDGPNNATIGAFHEFGTSRLPQRSFLRIPISDNLEKEMEKAGALDKEVLKEVIAEGSLVPWATKISVIAESIVLGAFDTGGYGKWKPSNMKYKANGQTLVETQQLRNSITSEVK